LRSCFLIAAVLLIQACTYTRAVTQTNLPSDRSQKVSAEVYRFIFFATFDSDETARLISKLQEKCPGKSIRGLTVKDLRTMYFLFIFWAREVSATGYCVGNQGMANNDPTIEPDIGGVGAL
jgi:hypothetical protein